MGLGFTFGGAHRSIGRTGGLRPPRRWKNGVRVPAKAKDWQIYIVRMGDLPYVKIGLTSDLYHRQAALQTDSPYPVTIIATIPCLDQTDARNMERVVHDSARERASNQRGEWFALADWQVREVVAEVNAFLTDGGIQIPGRCSEVLV